MPDGVSHWTRTLGDTLFMALPCPPLSLALTNKNLSQMLAATMLCPQCMEKSNSGLASLTPQGKSITAPLNDSLWSFVNGDEKME